MYKPRNYTTSNIKGVEVYEAETIEMKVARVTQNKEPITDGAPEIFTEKKDGVLAAYNIRTDRFEIAADAMDAIHRSKTATRDNVAQAGKVIEMNSEKDGKAEPTQGKASSGDDATN